jgi:hypothetical protein
MQYSRWPLTLILASKIFPSNNILLELDEEENVLSIGSGLGLIVSTKVIRGETGLIEFE